MLHIIRTLAVAIFGATSMQMCTASAVVSFGSSSDARRAMQQQGYGSGTVVFRPKTHAPGFFILQVVELELKNAPNDDLYEFYEFCTKEMRARNPGMLFFHIYLNEAGTHLTSFELFASEESWTLHNMFAFSIEWWSDRLFTIVDAKVWGGSELVDRLFSGIWQTYMEDYVDGFTRLQTGEDKGLFMVLVVAAGLFDCVLLVLIAFTLIKKFRFSRKSLS